MFEEIFNHIIKKLTYLGDLRRLKMAKIKLSIKEIEKMIKDQLNVKKVEWDEDGNCEIEMDLDEIKKQAIEIVKREEHHHYHGYPIYVEPIRVVPRPYPYWTVTTTTKTPTITYSCGTVSSTDRMVRA